MTKWKAVMQEELVTKVQKKFELSSLKNIRFKQLNISFKTGKNGNAILLFIGKRNENGNIIGERYARTLKYNRNVE